MIRRTSIFAFGLYLLGGLLSTAWAGPVFLTGHDPDFHSQSAGAEGVGATNLLRTGLQFATGNTVFSNTEKFLWVESRIATPGGHRIGELGLSNALGLSLGVHYDRADAAELAAVDFNNYTAIAVASSFGGLLTRAELDVLIARKADIESFINAGGGLFAAAECFPCGANLLAGAGAPDLFGYLPVDVTSIGVNPPFFVQPFGTSLGLVNSDLQAPTHNAFGLTGGLQVVDLDESGNPVTLAGNVRVNGGFIPVPEPSSVLLLGLGLIGLGFARRR